MWQKRRLMVNAASSIIQIGLNIVILFILYKFLLGSIGVEKLGIWSLVLAASSVTVISNFGLTGSILKYVAKHLALGDRKRVSLVVQTAVISVGAISGLALVVGYPFLKWILGWVIPADSLSVALAPLPGALIALWLMILTGICQGGLDGCQRIDIRNIILLAAAVLNLVLCVLLAPKFQLVGLAYAKMLGNLITLLASWIALRRLLPELPAIPKIWRRDVFQEIVRYGANFQLISVIAMLFDPVTKGLLSKFGSLPVVGYYEMANRMIIQVRALVISANQAVVPVIADINESDPRGVVKFYQLSYQLMVFLALPLFVMIVVATPLISFVWIGHIERTFVFASLWLSTGWLINTLNGPAFFAYLGIGELGWNVTGQLSIGIINFGLGIVLGTLLSGLGVIAAWAFALMIGSSIFSVSFHLKYKIPLSSLLPVDSRPLALICLMVLGAFYSLFIVFRVVNDGPMAQGFLSLALGFILLGAFWLHPMRRRLASWITTDLLGIGRKAPISE